MMTSTPQAFRTDPALAEAGLDLLRLDATEWALLEYSWLEQSPRTFEPALRSELIDLLETGLAEIEACRPYGSGSHRML
jgi:hypothetical protein